jgi:hypothetical protein
MTTVYIDDKTDQAKAVIEMLRTFGFARIEEQPRYNEETEQAMREAREGKTEKLDLENFRQQLYS